MMPTAHGQSVLVRERGEIMRMRSVHDKPDKRAPLFLWTKYTGPRQLADTLGCIMRQLRVVLENCRAPDSFDVINRRCEADRACDVGCSCFEAVRRSLKRALLKSDAHNHFATAVPRRNRIKNLSATVRSEERRVGKEWRERWGTWHGNEKEKGRGEGR